MQTSQYQPVLGTHPWPLSVLFNFVYSNLIGFEKGCFHVIPSKNHLMWYIRRCVKYLAGIIVQSMDEIINFISWHHFSKYMYMSLNDNIKDACDKIKGTFVRLVNSGIIHEHRLHPL